MKILQVIGDSKYGGATYLVLEWCKYLLARGCMVHVMSTDTRTIEALSHIEGLRVIQNIYIPREISPKEDCAALISLYKLISQEKYDVVHTYTATPGFIGRLAAHLSKVPAIFHHQAGWTITEYSSYKARMFYTPLEYISTWLSTSVICVSYAVAGEAKRLHIAPNRKLVTICNGINPSPFLNTDKNARALRLELGLCEETLIVGMTGRLAAQKDIPTLLQATSVLRSMCPSLSFAVVIVGDGPDHHMLQSLACELGISDFVYFLGFRKDIPVLLSGMDIFISTSLWEGLSISLLEAMAAARPIVATSIPPNEELIEDEITGLLVPPRSPKKIADAIVRFVEEPALSERCATEARKKALETYTIDRMFEETWALYNQFSPQKAVD